MRNSLVRLVSPLLLLGSGLSAQDGTAVFEVTDVSTWSATTHPVAFPSNPHYSGLIGATHNAAVSFWQPGGIASNGIEAMAEAGATGPLRSEVQAAIARGTARTVVAGPGLGTSPGMRKMRFTVSASHPRLTLVSMLAPSPDWFAGVSGLDLMKNGRWADEIVVPLHLYDAGTDSGPSYRSPDRDTQPREKIARVTTASGPFKNRTTLIGTYTIKRIAATIVYGCGVNPAGSMTTTGTPLLGNTVRLSVHDPLNSVRRGTSTFLVFGVRPTPNFPCGQRVPNFGLGRPGTVGELLIAGIAADVRGSAWQGRAVPFDLTVPNRAALIGAAAYAQGVLVDGTRVGLTDAVELHPGR